MLARIVLALVAVFLLDGAAEAARSVKRAPKTQRTGWHKDRNGHRYWVGHGKDGRPIRSRERRLYKGSRR